MPGDDDDRDMETLDGLKLTPGPMPDRATVPPAAPRPPAPRKGTAQFALETIKEMHRSNVKADALQFKQAIESLERSNTGLRLITLSLVIALLAIIAGLLGVGVTGKIPGVGEVQIVGPPDGSQPAGATPAPVPEVIPGDPED